MIQDLLTIYLVPVSILKYLRTVAADLPVTASASFRLNLSKLRWFSNMRQSALSNGYIIRPFNDWYSDSKTTLLQYNMTMGGIFGDSRFVDRAWKLEDAIPISEKASGFDASYSMKPLLRADCRIFENQRNLLKFIRIL